MKRLSYKIGWIGGFALIAIATHMAILHLAPFAIMSKVMNVMGERGVPLHKFASSPRITPKTQTVVRPSPDLAYAICRFDLTHGDVLISGVKWDGYASLTVFDAATNAVFITSLNNASLDTINSDTSSVILTLDADVKTSSGMPVVRLKKPKGLALIRRLAPTTELYSQAFALTKSDICMVMQTVGRKP